MQPMTETKNIVNTNLKELSSSGYEMVHGEPDIRGWKVVTRQNEKIGKVDELLFDTVTLSVRYAIVDIDGKPLNLISRKVLIPIGLAELHEKDDVVYFSDVTVGHLASLPEYKKGKVTLETETAIRTLFIPVEANAPQPVYTDDINNRGDFYKHEYFDHNRMYNSRRLAQEQDDVDNATVNRRHIPVDRDEDTQRIDEKRTPDEPVQKGGFAPFEEGVIEIKEHSEVPVVSKEARVVEEVSVKKDVDEHDEKVKDSVRKTEVDVEKMRKDDVSDK